MATAPATSRAPRIAVFVSVISAAVVLLFTAGRETIRTVDGLGAAILTGSALLASLAIFLRSRSPDAWPSARWLGFGVLGLAGIGAVLLVHDLSHPITRPGAYDAAILLTGLLFLVPAGVEFRHHFTRQDAREISADVALVSVAAAAALYLSLRPVSSPTQEAVAAAVFSIAVASIVSAYAALTLWMPAGAHAGLLAAMAGIMVGALALAHQVIDGVDGPSQVAVELPLALSALLVAGLVSLMPRSSAEGPRPPARYARATLTTLAVATACAALALVAIAETHHRLEQEQATALIGLLACAVALRILVNQVRGTNATREAQDALDQKEMALRETDKALARLRRANETLRESEERLRTVFEAAVDGIVELDHRDTIVRANEAFCRMIELPQSLVEGQPWTTLAASIEADESFGSLPRTGQGTLRREGHAVYLESRISEIPGAPPRRLLLVRDVTASRVADQTIRSLFKFLQDRDEDRTRIMRRTNAAIESERNRMARDLHDGPVQGVSAASLSLEAVLLMLKAGDLQEATEVLAKVRRELSEEADALRRLMSGLRPPLLEERGLIPALREMLDRYGRDNDIGTEFIDRPMSEIPADLETLAYRVVQEALSNSSKHAKALRVTISVEAVGGQLRVEVADDGIGFDSAQAREYLRMGRVGLASMRERVELANGTFMVHSTPGRGTTVMATLPLDAVPAPKEFAVHDA